MKRRAFDLIGAVMLAGLVLPNAAMATDDSPGHKLFLEKGCLGCHSVGGQGGQVGPSLDQVADRYTPEWLYTWLRDPAAVKPGTVMPKLPLTDEDRALLVFYLIGLRSDAKGEVPVVASADAPADAPDLDPDSPENDYLDLGTKESYVGEQRHTLQDQVQSFIPPLYEPAFTQSAFVLPPGAVRIASAYRHVGTIDANDVAGERELGARVLDFDLKRQFYDVDLFLGLDHNFTLRVNVPILTSQVDAKLNPAFFSPVSVFPQGSSTDVGDISVFLKKKFFDQGNFPFGLAGVLALRLPTGENDAKFSRRVTATTPMGSGLVAGDGVFRRFSDDGRLPAPLQPGLGTLGGSVGLFTTRQFDEHGLVGRGALHSGALYEVRPQDDGIDPGNLLTYFVTGVKPLIGDNLSLDVTYLLTYQEEDEYAGLTGIPTPTGPVLVPRPSFSGGATQFVATSLIFTPNPLFRFTATGLFRIDEPRLGGSPPWVFRLGLTYTFASGLFQSGEWQ